MSLSPIHALYDIDCASWMVVDLEVTHDVTQHHGTALGGLLHDPSVLPVLIHCGLLILLKKARDKAVDVVLLWLVELDGLLSLWWCYLA